MKALFIKDLKYIALPVSILLSIDALVLTAPLSSDAMKNLIILFWLPTIAIYGLFSNEYNSGWNKYVKSLPLSDKEIVGEKFIVSTGLIVLIQITMLFFGSIRVILESNTAAYFDLILFSSSAILFICITVAVFIPCAYSSSPLKGIFISLFAFLCVVFPIYYACISQAHNYIYYDSGGNAYRYVNYYGVYMDTNNLITIFWICSILGYLSLFISYWCSLKIFKNKDY